MFKEIEKCLVCGSSSGYVKMFSVVHTCDTLQLLSIANSPESFVNKCRHCDHYFLSPVLDEKLIRQYYSKINSTYYNYPAIHAKLNTDKNVVSRIQEFKKSGKVLEIGCGNGFLLKMLADIGYDCVGLEPSPKAFQFAKEENNLKVINSFLEANTFEENTFDVVIILDVLEHLYQPNEVMKLIYRVLKPEGIVLAVTGDVLSLNAKIWKSKWFYFFTWEHISFFSKSSLKQLFVKTNFHVLDVKTVSHSGSMLYNYARLVILNPLMYLYNFLILRRYKHISGCLDHVMIIAKK